MSLPTIGTSTDNAIARWNGTGGTAVQDSDAILADDGSLTLAGGLLLPTTGGTAGAFNHYENTQTLGSSITGPFNSAQVADQHVVRSGQIVTISFSPVRGSGGTSAAAPITLISSLATRYRPRHDLMFPVKVENESEEGLGLLVVSKKGTVKVYRDLLQNPFGTKGNVGFSGFSVSYPANT